MKLLVTCNKLFRLISLGRCPRLLILLAVVIVSNAASGALAETVTVLLDQAKVLRIPQQATTVVVGNPLIADIAVQSGGLIVVTGKGYGITNLIALDNRGNALMQETIEVQASGDRIVVVHRGIERESYSCMPKCERRIMLGDTPTYFDATLLQSGRRDSQAQGSSAAPPGTGR